ncbi:MAG: RNA polymerase sigma factor, partial [Anaerolineales bacterium]|nr:RNA polymerase sigma factor [Anaerolineales bacterium]
QEQVMIEDQKEHLRAALFQLTPEQRQVIVLKYIEDWSNAEIAAALNKSIGAVKALQHRGLAALRRMLFLGEESLT